MPTDYSNDSKQALSLLARVGGQLTAEEDIKFQGTDFVLPANMDLDQAIKFLKEKRAEDEKLMNFNRTFKYRPWDGARATYNALKKAFGMVAQRSTFSMFGEQPPSLITIDVGPEEQEQIPWGAMAIPLLENTTLYAGGQVDPELGPIYALTIEAPRKHRFHVEGIFRLVEEELNTNSMYRGKPFDGQTQPKFIDLTGFNPQKVVYAEETMLQLRANVWSVLQHTDALAEQGVSLKRAVLLEGPYGTGKTLAALQTAQIAVENGWTFIQCRPSRDKFDEVMQTARLYQPSVVFFEDVDTIADPNGSDENSVSKLLDIFDGIQAKDTRIMVVLTTNHKEKIHKGMLRPGRLDAVIHIGHLDASGYERLVRSIVPAEKLGDVDFTKVAEAFDGFLPSFAKEAIERAIRYNVVRNDGVVTELTTADFVESAEGLRPQLDLMNEADEEANRDSIGTAFAKLVDDRLATTVATDYPDDPANGNFFLTLVPNHAE